MFVWILGIFKVDIITKVEIELRSFITDSKYRKLLAFFMRKGRLVSRDNQISYYLNDEGSIRIQKNDFFAKLWIKIGKLHSAVHEEVEIQFDKKDFADFERAMSLLGFTPKIKWFRLRYTFRWKGVSVMLDKTRGYGNIIELEKICNRKEKSKTIRMLNNRLAEIGVKKTENREFDKRYDYYRKNWKRLTA